MPGKSNLKYDLLKLLRGKKKVENSQVREFSTFLMQPSFNMFAVCSPGGWQKMKNTVMFSRKQGTRQVPLMSHKKSGRQVKEERRSLVTHLPWDRGQMSDERPPVVTGLTCMENSFPPGNRLILRHNSTQSITVCKAQPGPHLRGCA